MRKIILFILLSASASQLAAQNLRDAGFMAKVQTGFNAIYNMDYDEAGQFFASLEKQYPHHPAPPLYLAIILWLEEMNRRQDLDLSRFMAPSYFTRKTSEAMPSEARSAFFSYLKKSESLTAAILSKNPRDKDGRYFLATVHGLRSSFAITIDHSLWDAFRQGNKAYSLCKQLIDEDPGYYDACLTVGIYEYVVGSIPWYVKWMALMIGARGTKKNGFERLALASEKAEYNKNEAQLVQMVLYAREGRHSESLALAKSLAERFPRNFLFPINIAQTLQYSGRKEQSAALFLQVLKRVEADEPNFNKLPTEKFRFSCAVALMNSGQLDLAEEQFVKSANNPKTPEREKALSHLHLGRILEKKGQRSKAAHEYQTVLSLREFEDSHVKAKRFLKKL